MIIILSIRSSKLVIWSKIRRTGNYRLAMEVLQFGNALTNYISFRKVLQHLQELADATGEAVFLGMPNGKELTGLLLPAQSNVDQDSARY